jgi:signal peptidase II
VRNTGAAFGFMAGWKHSGLVMTSVSCIAIPLILAYFFLLPSQNRLSLFGLALIFGGALGNLVDRFRYGYVVDFIDWHYKDVHWPAFNIADSAISVAIFFLLIDFILDIHRESQEAKGPA